MLTVFVLKLLMVQHKNTYETDFPTLFRRHWSVGNLAEATASIEADILAAEYRGLWKNAPRRSRLWKQYFLGHSGQTPHGEVFSRKEENFAVALVNLGRYWPVQRGGWFRFLDYQVPLKARQTDSRIGKIDLCGVTDSGRLVVSEVKFVDGSDGRSDPPPAALMEGLRYAAMVEADIHSISAEAEERFGLTVQKDSPVVQLLAPRSWWCRWLELEAAGDWGAAFERLIAATEERIGLSIQCLALEDVGLTPPKKGRPPRLERTPALYPVFPGAEHPIGPPVPPLAAAHGAAKRYLEVLDGALWAWADQHCDEQLDGGRRIGRPPVLEKDHSEKNILLPFDLSKSEAIRSAVPVKARHKWFRSLRSSQALTQCVFGAIAAYGQEGLLSSITTECGRPAFADKPVEWKIELEHEVDSLGEKQDRKTSVDVMLETPEQRVAVECKLAEKAFGVCSRPGLKTKEVGFCDGNYRMQAERNTRCALTEIGIRYWDHLPQLFDWPADRDHVPCPFGPLYQLARNALAATVRAEGGLNPRAGHVLVLYDRRNPAFGPGGAAAGQWEAAVASSLIPGLLRRMTWQRLAGHIASVSELGWLVVALEEKYGIIAD